MLNAQPIRLVCFDLGGVLIRICRTWPEACAAAGFEVRGDWEMAADARREICLQFSTGRMNGATWARQISELYAGLYSPHEISVIHRGWLLGEYEGVGDLIDRIHEAGLPTACLSNTDANHWAQLTEFPVLGKLHHRWASHLLKFHKPDPAIYRAAEQRLGYRGGEILFFDDMPENVEAARDVGWHAELIDQHSPPAQQMRAALARYGVLAEKTGPKNATGNVYLTAGRPTA